MYGPQEGGGKPRVKRSEIRNTRKNYVKRYERLKQIRSTYLSHWREISELTVPRRIRMLYTDRNQGGKLNQNIINSTGTSALSIMSSGMMSGISSPARPWFRLIVPQSDAMEDQEVREWLDQVEESIRTVFHRSNAYNALPTVYSDLGAFGVACMYVDEDDEDVIRCYVAPVGSYVLQNSARLQVDTVYREYTMSVDQIESHFGLDHASPALIRMFEDGKGDEEVRVLHCVEPNQEYDPERLDWKGKRHKSVWLEMDCGEENGEPLYTGNGYFEFPAMCPRWDVTGENVYGDSPGMKALGDLRGVQKIEARKLTGLGRAVNPAMVAPSSMKNKKMSLLEGDVTHVDTMPGGQKYEPAIKIDPSVYTLVREEIMAHEKRIMSAFHADLFLMMSLSDRREITAREVDERHEEKMLQLGPVLERLHDELLGPMIWRTFQIMVRKSEPEWAMGRRGLIPQPPEAIQGMDLRIEYISIMAQAQKLLGTAAIERMVGFVGSLLEASPEAIDKIDVDKVIDEYAEMLGVSPELVRTGNVLQEIRDQRAQAAQQAQMAAAAKPMSDLANAGATLSQADVNGTPILNRLVSTLQPNVAA